MSRRKPEKPCEPPVSRSLYEGRELIGTIIGIGRDWRAIDALGNSVSGAPFSSQKAAAAALNAVRPNPCAADARFDNG